MKERAPRVLGIYMTSVSEIFQAHTSLDHEQFIDLDSNYFEISPAADIFKLLRTLFSCSIRNIPPFHIDN